jgi:hypothetical protein
LSEGFSREVLGVVGRIRRSGAQHRRGLKPMHRNPGTRRLPTSSFPYRCCS